MSRAENKIDELTDKLRALGLTLYEARVYLTLLLNGSLTTTEIVKLSKIPHPRVYDITRSLESKGLIEAASAGRPKAYRAIKPEFALRGYVEGVKRKLEYYCGSLVVELEKLYATPKTARVEDVWRLKGARAILNKAAQVIRSARHELLIASTPVVIKSLVKPLDDSCSAGVNTCVVSCGDLEPPPKCYELRVKPGCKTFVLVADRSSAMFVPGTGLSDGGLTDASIGLYTEMQELVDVFVGYCMSMRAAGRIVRLNLDPSALPLRYIHMARAADIAGRLLSQGFKVRARVIGRRVGDDSRVEVSGPVEGVRVDEVRGYYTLIVRDSSGVLSVGGWDAYVEDVRGDVIEIDIERS